MGIMKDFDIRIRGGGDDAIAAVEEYVAEQERLIAQVQSMLQRACDRDWKEWIPVTECLPKEGVDVLVASPCPNSKAANIDIASLEQEGEHAVWREADCGRVQPTHWMPLPAPPTDAK